MADELVEFFVKTCLLIAGKLLSIKLLLPQLFINFYLFISTQVLLITKARFLFIIYLVKITGVSDKGCLFLVSFAIPVSAKCSVNLGGFCQALYFYNNMCIMEYVV